MSIYKLVHISNITTKEKLGLQEEQSKDLITTSKKYPKTESTKEQINSDDSQNVIL